MIGLLIILVLIYAYQVYQFFKGWNELSPYDSSGLKPKVSIVIAVRNEEENIPFLIEDLSKQDYPLECLEIIIVDDFSDDNTFQILNDASLHLNVLRSESEGKKAAINTGVLSAKHDLILTTDADCRFSANWVSCMLAPFAHEAIHLVSGPVAYSNLSSLFDKFQALEFISLIGSGAGAIGVDKAFMCNGANMAFRKSIFASTNTHIASGDDVFLLHHVKSTGGKIAFVKEQSAIVFTQPKASVTEFINQRKRWASKSSSYQDFTAKWISFVVFLTNLMLLWLVFSYQFKLAAVFFCVKFIIDYGFVRALSRFFFYQKYLSNFWIMSIIYPIYIVWVALSSQLTSFEWKGRKHQR